MVAARRLRGPISRYLFLLQCAHGSDASFFWVFWDATSVPLTLSAVDAWSMGGSRHRGRPSGRGRGGFHGTSSERLESPDLRASAERQVRSVEKRKVAQTDDELGIQQRIPADADIASGAGHAEIGAREHASVSGVVAAAAAVARRAGAPRRGPPGIPRPAERESGRRPGLVFAERAHAGRKRAQQATDMEGAGENAETRRPTSTGRRRAARPRLRRGEFSSVRL